MRNATHQAIGVASSFVATATVGGGLSMCAIAATAALYGSRLPDVDQPGSRIHHRSRLESRHLLVRALGLVVRLPMIIIALTVRHRGATHWLLTSAVITATLTVLAAALSPMLALPVGLGVGLGYTAHLLADACTPPGAPLLGPFSRRRQHVLPRRAQINRGSTELAIRVLCAATIVLAALFIIG